MIPHEEGSNFRVFLDCISAPLIEKCTSSPPLTSNSKRKTRANAKAGRKTAIKPVSIDIHEANERGLKDVAELADFIEVVYYFSNSAIYCQTFGVGLT